MCFVHVSEWYCHSFGPSCIFVNFVHIREWYGQSFGPSLIFSKILSNDGFMMNFRCCFLFTFLLLNLIHPKDITRYHFPGKF